MADEPTSSPDLDMDAALDAAFGSSIDTTPTPEPAEPEPSPEAPPSGDDPFASVPDNQVLLHIFRERYGKEYGAKYQTDEAFMDGIRELERSMGQRNEDAALFRQFRENPQAFLQQYGYAQSQPGPPQPTQDASAQGMSFDELQRLRGLMQFNRETGRAEPKPGAPPDVVERYEREMRRVNEWAFNAATNPDSLYQQFAERFHQPFMQQVAQYVQGALHQQQQLNAVTGEADQWIAGRSKDLYIDGDPQRGFTPLGASMRETLLNQYWPLVQAGQMTPAQALDTALAVTVMRQPRQQPTAPANPQAQRTPNLANGQAAPDEWAQKPNEDIDAYSERLWKMVADGKMPPGTPGT